MKDVKDLGVFFSGEWRKLGTLLLKLNYVIVAISIVCLKVIS